MSARGDVTEHLATSLVEIDAAHPLRVAVDGITAAGKSTFAHELALAVRARGRPCVHVSMDGFHHPRAVRHRRGRESADGYYEDAYDFDALRRLLLDPLGVAGGRRYRTAIIDLGTDQPVAEPARTAEPDLVVIVDGSFLQRHELDGAWDVTVFLRSSFEAARARGAARDAAHFGSVAEAQRIFDVRYHAAQRRYLEEVDPEARADIVIEHDDPTYPRLVRDLQPM